MLRGDQGVYRQTIAPIAEGEPTPEMAAMVAEEIQLLLERLDDAELRQIAVLKLEGATHEEIARELGCVTRTVARKMKLIRKIAQAEMEDG